MMLRSIHSAALVVTVLLAGGLVAACGPSPEPVSPIVPTAAPVATSSGAPAVTASAGPSAGPSLTSTLPAARPAFQPLVASKLLQELKQAGVDPAKTPELEKLPMDLKKKVMPLMMRALGFDKCTGCHVAGDFKAESRNKIMARNMWKHFVAPLRDEKGAPIFCDSCHNGKTVLLDRSDRSAVKSFMEIEYAGKLTRADKQDQECSSCHGDGMELKIFTKLWKVPPP